MLVAASSMAFVSASEEVSIGGMDFNIPDGFDENTIYRLIDDMDENGVINNIKAFEKGDDVIYICVADFGDKEMDTDSVSELGNEFKTINGVDGYTYDDGWVEGYEDVPLYGFIYAKNGDIAMIITTDESLFEEVIVK